MTRQGPGKHNENQQYGNIKIMSKEKQKPAFPVTVPESGLLFFYAYLLSETAPAPSAGSSAAYGAKERETSSVSP